MKFSLLVLVLVSIIEGARRSYGACKPGDDHSDVNNGCRHYSAKGCMLPFGCDFWTDEDNELAEKEFNDMMEHVL